MQPENERLAGSLAEDLFFSDQYDEAVKIYEQIASHSPKDSVPLLRIAEIYRIKHDYAKAHDAIDRAKKVDPDGLEPRLQEIQVYQTEGKLDQAIAGLKSVLDDTARKIYSKDEQQKRAGWYEELGLLDRAAGHYPEAIEAFKQMGAVLKDSGPIVAQRTIETIACMPRTFPPHNARLMPTSKSFPTNIRW